MVYKRACEIFTSHDEKILKKSINKFLEELHAEEIIDIKFSTCGDEFTQYSALILFHWDEVY